VIEKTAKGEAVREFPKSDSSVRIVVMPSLVADTILAAARQPGRLSLLPIDHSLNARLDKVGAEWINRCFPLVAAGLPRVTLHELRHSYATLLAGARVYDSVLKRLMGHAVPGMTGLYAHITWAQLAAARSDVDRYLAGIATGADLATK
jgi:integrase